MRTYSRKSGGRVVRGARTGSSVHSLCGVVGSSPAADQSAALSAAGSNGDLTTVMYDCDMFV